jgi:peptidoglycan/xylan/chitin deacetylase (PgdA/CDA1 family)
LDWVKVADWKYHIAGVGLEMAYFSGLSRLAEKRASGQGLVLKLGRVRPRHAAAFRPLQSQEITPEFLDRIIATLKRGGFDIVSMDEACERSKRAPERRFAVLTFEGAYRDFLSHAYPVLRSHHLPFTVYASTGLIDGVVLPWWLVLASVIRQIPRVALVMNGEERRFRSTSISEKYAVFDVIHEWMRGLSPEDIAPAVKDICTRYRIDIDPIVRDVFMTWPEITTLAGDPAATIGSATVNYPALTNLSAVAALREMKMGRRVLESALQRPCVHFSYPFGDAGSFTERDVHLAEEAGFAGAVSSQAGLILTDGATRPLDMPRIVWDGRRSSTRALQVLMSGLIMQRRKTVVEAAAD